MIFGLLNDIINTSAFTYLVLDCSVKEHLNKIFISVGSKGKFWKHHTITDFVIRSDGFSFSRLLIFRVLRTRSLVVHSILRCAAFLVEVFLA